MYHLLDAIIVLFVVMKAALNLHVTALEQCQSVLCANPSHFLFGNASGERRRSGDIFVQMLTDATREQYQRATQVIYYHQHPFVDVIRKEDAASVVNRWSFDDKIEFIASLTAPTRAILSEIRAELVAADPSLEKSIEVIVTPLEGEPNPENDTATFRSFLAAQWKRSFFRFRPERTDTMNRYATAYATLWKAVIRDVARVTESAGTMLERIASEVASTLFDECAEWDVMNTEISFSATRKDPRSELLLQLRRVCIAIHNSLSRLATACQKYNAFFSAEIDSNIVPAFAEHQLSETEIKKREVAKSLAAERDRISVQLFDNARKLCAILDSAPFRRTGPITLEYGSEASAINSIQRRLVKLSQSNEMRQIIADANVAFGLGLSEGEELDKKFPLSGGRSLKLPIVLWLRHVFFGELIDNKNSEHERTTAFMRFFKVCTATRYLSLLDEYMQTQGPINILALSLDASDLPSEDKRSILEAGAQQITLTNIRAVTSDEDATDGQREIAANLTPFTYKLLDEYIASVNLDDAELVRDAKLASDEIQDFIREKESRFSTQISSDPEGYSLGDEDTLSALAGSYIADDERDLLRRRAAMFSLDSDASALRNLSGKLMTATANVVGVQASALRSIVTTTYKQFKDIQEEGTVGVSSRAMGVDVPVPPGGERMDPLDQRFTEYIAAIRGKLYTWDNQIPLAIDNMDEATIRTLYPDSDRGTESLRRQFKTETVENLALITISGEALYTKLKTLPRSRERRTELISNMEVLSKQITDTTSAEFVCAAKVAAEDLAYPVAYQRWYYMLFGVVAFAIGSVAAYFVGQWCGDMIGEDYSKLAAAFKTKPPVEISDQTGFASLFDISNIWRWFSLGTEANIAASSVLSILQAETGEAQGEKALFLIVAIAALARLAVRYGRPLLTELSTRAKTTKKSPTSFIQQSMGIFGGLQATIIFGLASTLGTKFAVETLMKTAFEATFNQNMFVRVLPNVIRALASYYGAATASVNFLSGMIFNFFVADPSNLPGAKPDEIYRQHELAQLSIDRAVKKLLSLPSLTARATNNGLRERYVNEKSEVFANRYIAYFVAIGSALATQTMYSYVFCGQELDVATNMFNIGTTAMLAYLVSSMTDTNESDKITEKVTGVSGVPPERGQVPLRNLSIAATRSIGR